MDDRRMRAMSNWGTAPGVRRGVAAVFGGLAVLAVVTPAAAQLGNTPWPMAYHDLRHSGRATLNGPSSENVKWTFPSRVYVKGSAAIGQDGTVYFPIGEALCGLDPVDGSEKFCRHLPGIMRRNAPAVGSNGTIYVGTRDNRLWAINPDGTEKWSYTVGNDGDVNVSPAIAPDGTIYMAGTWNGLVHALHPDGTLKWKTAVGGGVSYSSPAIGANGTIYIGSTRGELNALNPSGEIVWKAKVGRRIRFASPVISADGSNIYIGSTPG